MGQKLKELWDKVLDSAKKDIKQQTFETWFQPIQPVAFEHDRLEIKVDNQFFKKWIQEHYQKYLEELLLNITGKQIHIKIHVEKNESIQHLNLRKTPLHKNMPFSKNIFQTKYSFEDFVVGPSNRLAYAAAVAVAEKPSFTYNPLFLYGFSGLGKTHLLQSIGASVLKRYPEKNVVYISCEEFTNHLINAIQNRNTTKFRNRYRNVDVLLIDDVHFLSGKEQTQEEFFHTFNSLYDAKKQIILSSDKPPKEIKNLAERLISRFEWGLVSDIQAPDYETRIAILLKKADSLKLELPQHVIEFLATNIKTNIRKLEGSLIKLISYTSLTGKTADIENVKVLLHDLITAEKVISVEHIQKKVAEHFDIRLADMTSKKRPKTIAFPRQIAMCLCKHLTIMSLSEIGENFGGRDHTTVRHAIEVVQSKMNNDLALQSAFSSLRQKIQT